jgi:purine nucleosidase
MSTKIPLLLDTDPGSDIDDAVAISYLLRQPRCEFLGITTVSGDVNKRAGIADALCKSMNRTDIPIHAGASTPLWIGPGQPNVPHYAALGDTPHRTDFKPNAAVDFLRKTIRGRPGEITLMTIGPLTNIAVLFSIDPEIPSLLKGIVSMAGQFFSKESNLEWNCFVDPLATKIFYQSRPKSHISYGLDVTLKCTMRSDEVQKRFTPNPLPLVRKMADVWFIHAKEMTFHDPLVAASIFHPELCEYEDGEIQITVDPDAGKTGNTIFKPGASGRHRVAKTVKPSDFFEKYFSVFQ